MSTVRLTMAPAPAPARGMIGAHSESVGSQRFGTNYRYRYRNTGMLDGAILPIDLAANAASLGAQVIRVMNIEQRSLHAPPTETITTQEERR